MTISFIFSDLKCFPYHKCHAAHWQEVRGWLAESCFPFCSAQTGGTSSVYSFCMNDFWKAETWASVKQISYFSFLSVGLNEKKVFGREGKSWKHWLKMIIW